MTVSEKDKRGLVEELRTLRTRLARLERRDAELVQVEQELRESLEQFKTSFDDSPVGLYRTTPDGQILMANSAVVNMLGCSSFDELARRNLEKEGYEPRYPRLAFKERIEHEGKVIGLESAWKRSDGTTLYVRESAQAVRGESGSILYYQGTVEDITQRKLAEEALRKAHDELEMRVQERTAELRQANEALQAQIAERIKAERQIRERARIIDSTTDSVVKTDAGGLVTLWNRGAERIFGYTSEEMMGGPISILYREQDRGRLDEIIRALLKGEEIPTKEVTCVHKDGSLVELALSLFPLKDYGGNVTEFVGISKDITEYKRSETQLHNAMEKLRTMQSIINRGPVVLFLWRVAPGVWPVEVVSDNVENVLGYTAEDFTSGRVSWPGITHPDDVGRLEAQVKGYLEEGVREWSQEYRLLTKSGDIRWMRDWNTVLTDSTGQITHIQGIAVDTTDRQRAAEALRQSENRYKTVVEHAGEGIVVVQDGMLRFVNPWLTSIMGYSQEEFVSRPFIEFVHPDDREWVMEIYARRLQGREVPRVYELKVVDTEGRTKWIENNGVLIEWKGRVATLNFLRDITERKQTERTLRETTELLETIFAHTHILVAYLDPQFNFVRVNRAYAQTDGREPPFFVGRNHFELYPNAENEAIFRKVVQIGVPYFAHAKPFEYAGHPERGVSYWDWSLVPIKQQDGVVSGLVLTFVNVTEQKRAEQALQESEHRYHAIFEQAADSIVLIDPETAELVEFNDRAYENLGYSRDEFAKLTIADLNVVESAEEVLEHAEKVVTQGSDGFETKKRCRSGEIRDIQVSARSIALGGKNYIQSIWHDITDRKQAEEALYEREATLTNIFRAAPVGIGLECDRVLSRVNDTICEMLGYSREELVGQRANMFYPSEEDYQRIRGEKRRQILQKGTATIETRWKRKDGRIIDVLLSTIALDPADFSKGVTFTALDITERKRAEQALRESEEKFRSLAEQSPNMIFINKEGRVIYANKRCEEVMGYTREQLYSPDFDFLTMIAPESLDVIRENFARHLRGQEVEPYDYCLINKQGERIEAINASKLIHYEGETAILGIVTDITERKRAERELCESQERLKILFESAPDAIYLTDLEGRFVDGNRAAEELVGFAKAELIGKSLAESGLLSAEQLLLAAANLRKVAAGKPSGPTEYTIRRKDGSLIAIEVRTFPVRISDQVLSLGIARDVTARRQAQQRLLDDREQLKSLASALSLTEERERHRLATELHDQIGQSLVISKIKLDQLAKDESCGDLAKALHDVSVCLGQVISDTRSLTFDLSYPILYELGFEAAVAEWLTEHVQEEHGVETDFEDDGQSKPLDDDIRALLFRNVRELLINVVKHARARRVKVAVRRIEDQIRTCVEDDGMGFDPVEVTAMAAKRAEFGLFSIRERLEQLGGLFEVVSAPGRGTRITMTAPLKYRKKEG